MGSVDRYTRANLADLVYSVVKRDEVRTTRILLKITEWEEEPDIQLLERDVADIMGQTLYRPLKDIKIGKLLQDLLNLTSRYWLRIPANIFLMLKMLSTIEGIARQLNPEFDMASHAAPFIKREKMEKYQPRRIAEDMLNISSELIYFLRQFPKESMEILRQIKKQRLSVQFEHHGLESMIETHERISNKLSFAIIIAALVIGSSIIVIAKIPPMFYGISLDRHYYFYYGGDYGDLAGYCDYSEGEAVGGTDVVNVYIQKPESNSFFHKNQTVGWAKRSVPIILRSF